MFPPINSESNLPPVPESPDSARRAPTDAPPAPAPSTATVVAAPALDPIARSLELFNISSKAACIRTPKGPFSFW